mmetsp:Transcript_39865/g.58562  ORF Transcript_39865/g.58562 Transcript_39865/m.58562 type:complete len:1359 (+) Transcript_39865:239-4315(+)
MPPREAKNTYADQYLTLDYEIGGGPVGILAHDPIPPPTVTQQQDMDDDDVPDDDIPDSNTTTNVTNHTTNNTLNNAHGSPDSVHTLDTTTSNTNMGGTSNPSANATSQGGIMSSASGSSAAVDPLSIDTSDGLESVASAAAAGGLDMSMISTPMNGMDISSPLSENGSQSANANRGTHNGVGVTPQHGEYFRRRRTSNRFPNSPNGRIINVGNITSPMSNMSTNQGSVPVVSPVNGHSDGYLNVISVENGGNNIDVDGSLNVPGITRQAGLNESSRFFPASPPSSHTHAHLGGGGPFASRRNNSSGGDFHVSNVSEGSPLPVPDLDISDDTSLDENGTSVAYSEASASAVLTAGGSTDEEDGDMASYPGGPAAGISSVGSVGSPSSRSIRRNVAFDDYSMNLAQSPNSSSAPRSRPHAVTPQSQGGLSPPSVTRSSSSISSPPSQPVLTFGPNTTLNDLKYFAERGCIVALLNALNTPKLTALGARMLADYAKNPSRRVAVAGNKKILEFTLRTMMGCVGPEGHVEENVAPRDDISDALSRERAVEYAVETVRSLTATEESDRYLMGTPKLLQVLASVAKGGYAGHNHQPQEDLALDVDLDIAFSAANILTPLRPARPYVRQVSHDPLMIVPNNATPVMINSKSRLHACIAIMNLSCGKSNKIEIAKIPTVLDAMRLVMTDAASFKTNTVTDQRRNQSSSNHSHHAAEARLKATTCIKNLSNADANDAALLDTPGLIEAMGQVILTSIHHQEAPSSSEEDSAHTNRRNSAISRATTTITNACLALMNLSIAKANKHKVFLTPGVMEALMAVITRGTGEARVKSCSALSNLAIGYDNKIPMFRYKGFVEAILHVIEVDRGEARTKACSILWSFAAEMRNQVPVVQRGDILPVLVQVAEEDATTEARFKCVAALTLLAESLSNAMPLLESGALAPLMDILHEAGPDPTQWKGQTASWCVGFLMNMAQSDEAVPSLRNAGVVELLAPLLTLDHYQSLKAAMAVTFVCRYDEGDETYDLLRRTETVIPKIINLLHNTLSGKGGNGYKYGVFTLRSSVGCIQSLASGPDFMKERMATKPVYESLLRVLSDFCVDCTPGAIVGGGKDDAISPSLAIMALHDLTGHLIPAPGTPYPFGPVMEERLLTALQNFENTSHPEVTRQKKILAKEVRYMMTGKEFIHSDVQSYNTTHHHHQSTSSSYAATTAHIHDQSHHPSQVDIMDKGIVSVSSSLSNTNNNTTTGFCVTRLNACSSPTGEKGMEVIYVEQETSNNEDNQDLPSGPVRTFLLSDGKGRRFAVPIDPSGGRMFNDNKIWCYRRGRFCLQDEIPDPNFRWTSELQTAYVAALAVQEGSKQTKNNQDEHMI